MGLLFIHYITSTKIIHKLRKGLFVPFHSNCKMTSNSVCSQFVSTSGIVYKCQIVCRRALYGRGRAIIRIYTRSVTLNSILQTPYLMVKPSNVVLKLNCLTWIGLHHEGETVFRRGRGRKEKKQRFQYDKGEERKPSTYDFRINIIFLSSLVPNAYCIYVNAIHIINRGSSWQHLDF